jgi:alpha-beta hydrolase superfamily lysophospholipase
MTGSRGFDPDLASTAQVDFGVTRDGVTQLRRRWMATDPRGVALLVHGLGEHSGRYEHVARQLCDADITTVSYDHRGFGESGGRRADVERFSRYVDDLEDQLTQLRTLGLPTVVIGHSLGGLISACHAVSGRPQPDRLVLSAPALALDASALTEAAAKVAARFAPRVEISTPFSSDDLATDPRVGRHYDADPLVYTKLTVRLAAQMAAATEFVRSRHERLTTPTLVLHGSGDRLVDASVSESFGRLPGVERRLLPGLGHEVFNEPIGPDLIDDVIAWAFPD